MTGYEKFSKPYKGNWHPIPEDSHIRFVELSAADYRTAQRCVAACQGIASVMRFIDTHKPVDLLVRAAKEAQEALGQVPRKPWEDYTEGDTLLKIADYKRARACVNACAGIEDPETTVPALLALAEELSSLLHETCKVLDKLGK